MRVILPIKSIIYFEAAARLQSFKLAAMELNVTPGAISHQISTLEDFIGKKVFERGSRRVTLTYCGLGIILEYPLFYKTWRRLQLILVSKAANQKLK